MTFLTRCNPRAADSIIASGVTSGELALNPNIPTLADIASVYGTSTAVLWVKIQIDNIDNVGGARAISREVIEAVSRLIFAKYKNLNTSNLLQFFARYKIGDYNDATAYVGGAEKILVALRLYNLSLEDDVRRIMRDEYYAQQAVERERWQAAAITYDQYKAIADEEVNCGG